MQRGPSLPPPPEQPMTADRVRWEHIQRVFEQCDRNVSETARRLRMHRRTLQRILRNTRRRRERNRSRLEQGATRRAAFRSQARRRRSPSK